MPGSSVQCEFAPEVDDADILETADEGSQREHSYNLVHARVFELPRDQGCRNKKRYREQDALDDLQGPRRVIVLSLRGL